MDWRDSPFDEAMTVLHQMLNRWWMDVLILGLVVGHVSGLISMPGPLTLLLLWVTLLGLFAAVWDGLR